MIFIFIGFCFFGVWWIGDRNEQNEEWIKDIDVTQLY